jgi:hypothetical protein
MDKWRGNASNDLRAVLFVGSARCERMKRWGMLGADWQIRVNTVPDAGGTDDGASGIRTEGVQG